MEQYLNLAVLFSIVMYMVQIDRRLTRIETKLQINGEKNKQGG